MLQNGAKIIKKKMQTERIIKKVKPATGTYGKLAKMFVVNRKTVSFAINGKSNTDLAKKNQKSGCRNGRRFDL
jgi:predicted transcriptional regulator